MAEPTLGAVLEAIAAMRTEFTDRIDHLDHRIDRLEEGQTRLRIELSGRMDRLQNGVDGLRQGYVVDWTNVDRTTRIAQNALDEVRSLGEQMMQVTKWIHMLEAQIRDLRGDG